MYLESIDLNEFIDFADAEKVRDSVSSEDHHRFSAHPKHVPREYLSSHYPSKQQKEQYKEYLKVKYAYFTHCIDNSRYTEMSKESVFEYKSLFDFWDEKVQTDEACVYLLRRNQFGEDSLAEWYSGGIDEFNEWTSLLSERNYLDEHPYSDDFKKFNPSFQELDLVQSIENEVSEKFIELFEANRKSESEYLFEFLNILKIKSGAKVCDFLYVDSDNNKVDFELASMKLSTPDMEDLKKEESYHERIGITGSILVSCQNKYFHVGTNNLFNDPRQAERQNTKYAKIYKLNNGVKSFWVFPIRDFNNKIIAAFRVVDKEDDTTWSYSERFSLLLIAEWFSCFWNYTLRMIRTQSADDVRNVIFKCSNCEFTTCFGHQKYIDKKSLEKIFKHFRSVVHRKVESHNIGASILVVQDKNTINNEYNTHFTRYPMTFNLPSESADNDLEYLSLAYKGINPKSAMFVYDKQLNFIDIYFIRTGSTSFLDGIKNIGKYIDESVLFTCAGGTEPIRIYQRGEMVADYYQSESEGIWRFRCINDIKKACEKVYENENFDRKTIEKVLEISLELSFQQTGAMIVICDDNDIELKLRDGKRAIGNVVSSNINDSEVNLICDYAAMDGAIVLKSNGVIREIGTILPVEDITNDRNSKYFDKYEQWEYWKSELSKKQKGSRHTTAIKFSLQHKNACIFVISENRGISIFYDGQAILWDDEFLDN